MKPLKLEFAAFGSYPDRVEVDFTQLKDRGLFVISGDTGTGKTTVFDAMSFALFGEMPSKPAGDIRSHHADPSTETYAQFTFELGGSVYVARQTPMVEKLKRDGSGTTSVSRKASLRRIEGDQATVVADKTQAVDTYIKKLIGLTADQFKRVMVLPQGEVQQFLFDSSGNRETLLRRLFGGDVFEKITENLKQQSKAAADEVGVADIELNQLIGKAADEIAGARQVLELEPPAEGEQPDRTLVGDRLEALRGLAKTLETNAATSRTEANSALAKATQAEEEERRYDSAKQHRERLGSLDQQEASIHAAKAAADRSGLARPVVVAANDALSAAKNAEKAIADAESASGELREAVERAGLTLKDWTPVSVSTAITQASADLVRQQSVLTERDNAAEAASNAVAELNKWQEAVTQNKAAQTEIESDARDIDQQLGSLSDTPVDTSAIEAECVKLSAALQDIGERDALLTKLVIAEETEEAAGEVEAHTMLGYLQSEVPRMASQLRDGEPCLVCGSTEHPRPGVAENSGSVVSHDDVRDALEKLREARESRSAVEAEIAAVKATLGIHAESDSNDVAHLLKAAKRERGELETAIQERAALRKEHDGLTEKLAKLKNEKAELSGRAAGLRQDRDDAEKKLQIATGKAEGIDAAVLQLRQQAIADASTLLGPYEQADNHKTKSSALRAQADSLLTKTLDASIFATVDEARGALLTVEEEQEAFTAQSAHEEAKAGAVGALRELESQGIPDTRPDAQAIRTAADAAESEATELGKRNTQVQGHVKRATKALEEFDNLEAGSLALRERAEAAAEAHAVCHGSDDVNLLRWVLAQQLDQIVAVASVHFQQMSNGRYTIRRRDDGGGRGKKGLDLTIDDAHTGRSRVPSSLSGGERFQGSLALALALADVVSRSGLTSSHSPEALFIDEGFGTLDEAALDEVIDTLYGLQEQGRMVGVITHLATMKERLHPGIVVERRSDGRGSKLTVNP